MRRSWVAVLAALALVAPPASVPADVPACGGPVVVKSTGWRTVVDNGCVRRLWEHNGVGLRTLHAIDRRTGTMTSVADDFRIAVNGTGLRTDLMPVLGVTSYGSGTDHARVEWRLLAGPVEVTRSIDVYSGLAAFRASIAVRALTPTTLNAYEVDRLAVRNATVTLHAFRAGADWREPGWRPQLSIGDAHTGTWREARTAPEGSAISGTAQWVSAELPGGARAAMILERHDYASSRGSYNGTTIAAGVDLSRDVVYLGPFEEDAHVENPGPGPARARALRVGETLELEPVVTLFGIDADDEAWQFWRYLYDHRMARYPRAVVFNSDQVDRNEISTGAKDDMNHERFLRILPAVRQMGAEVFVFDDGWQARSGDFCPDSPQCPEPRWDGSPTSKYRPRFPDDTFTAVREALRGDPADPSDDLALGLWMNPMSFHPSAHAFRANPQWSCVPVGTATGAASIVDPNSSSNEAGIGLWNPRALGVDPDDGVTPQRLIDHIEERLLRAIEEYGATYFKLDFLVWVDCAGLEPVTIYEYHDEFVAMLDRVHAKHPNVTLQVDDTNDYRMWPFETVARGPSWFLNGGRDINDILHVVWNHAPYIPGAAIGLRALSADREHLDTVMAAAILTHLTFSFPVDEQLTSEQRDAVRRWTDFYKQHRAILGGFTLPLLSDPVASAPDDPTGRRHAWTALQPWDLDAREGWVFAFRQQATNATQPVPLRGLAGVPDDAPFTVQQVDPARPDVSFAPLHTTAAELRAGLPVTVAATNGYALFRVTPA